MSDQPWTIGQLIHWTTDFLREKGAESPRLDAEVLLAYVGRCKRIDLYAKFTEPASDELRARFRELVKERAAGKPVAYLVGQREFFSLSFAVTPDVLIPRPETELLVVRALDVVREMSPQPAVDGPPTSNAGGQRARRISIADVGTGSGALAVTLAKHLPDVAVAAIDLSGAALAVARGNAERLGAAERIEWFEGDLLAAAPADRSFDLIVSNPPYVTTDELRQLAVDVRRYEPALALDGGPLGTTVIERLIPQAAERLRPGGQLLIEVSPMIVDRVEKLLEAESRLQREPTHKDSAGLARVVEARRKEGG